MGRDAVLRRAGGAEGSAKNVVLLIGDGLGVSTITAARLYKGQRHGHSGEETLLAWDNFPAIAMTKVSAHTIYASTIMLRPAYSSVLPSIPTFSHTPRFLKISTSPTDSSSRINLLKKILM
ncbi:hypothetical protein AAG570_000948 [Ranatra chinensis]|uniref:alkaline phosphatase n=1 Tax=Ranatra chinensis TaxID=642074 RepID=A0ABD0ZB86_9HEMI